MAEEASVPTDPDLTKNGAIFLLAMIHKDEEHGSKDVSPSGIC